MSLGNKVPVYLVNGFLESGKTLLSRRPCRIPIFQMEARRF